MQQFIITLERVTKVKYIMLLLFLFFFYRVVHTILVNDTDVHYKYFLFTLRFSVVFFFSL